MAVYTEVSDEELIEFADQYNIGSVSSLKGIAEGVENSNYLLQTDQGPYILTLYEKRVNRDELPFFLNLLDHLSTHGITCPQPVHGKDGKALRELCGRPAAIFTFLPGMWPKRIKPEHCSELGSALAHLHVATQNFDSHRANSLNLAGWQKVLNDCQGRGDEVAEGLNELLQTEIDYLSQHWPNDLPKGIIHADLFPDNVFFRGDKLSGLIDFYFACEDLFAYDLAICLNAWCFEPGGEFNVTKAKLMLSSYRKVRDFSAAEVESLPIIARGAAMRFIVTRLYDWLNTPKNAMVRPKDPMQYVKILRFHQGVKSASAYGLK